MNIITRIQLRIKEWGSPKGLEISIRDELLGEDLTSVYLKNEDISVIPSGFWFEFDFPDTLLTPEKTYYIIWSPDGAPDKYNTYYWGLKDGNYYDRGAAWHYLDGEWEKLEPDFPKGDPDFVFKTFGTSNSPPEKPINLNGPDKGEIGENLYYESTYHDTDSDILSVYFDWGDGSNSGWIPSVSNGIFGLTHSWESNGSYQVKTKAKDVYFESPWSDSFTVIIGNIPPEKPEKPYGPISGIILALQNYSTSTIDYNDDSIFYLFDWGDGNYSDWLGPYESGVICEATHMWDEEGDYEIKVKAKDENGEESVWSDSLSVSMPKSKSNMPFGFTFVFGFDVDVKLVQLQPGEDYVDLEVLSKPFYIWENEIITRNPGEFIRLYNAKGLFSPSLSFCFGFCDDWGIIG
jgi:hypothetical protein